MLKTTEAAPSPPNGMFASGASARDERLQRISQDLATRARRVFPELSHAELAAFIERLAGHRLEEEDRRAMGR